MREVLVISGKGGTGKTSLTAAFAAVATNALLCDLDVDAPDLHILLSPQHQRVEEFWSGNEAIIDAAACNGCGECARRCRYDAVRERDGVYSIDGLRCEGCKVCVAFCPVGAIAFPERRCGDWYVSTTRFGSMVHAQLYPGQENSGRLVTLLKQEARQLAEAQRRSLILCDGAPGIGCPVISSLAGTNLAVIVTEPTPSGRHDLERVVGLCDHFRIKTSVIVNKCDLNPAEAAAIKAFCRERGCVLLGDLPHDALVTQAMLQRKAVTEIPDAPFGQAVRELWERVEALVGL